MMASGTKAVVDLPLLARRQEAEDSTELPYLVDESNRDAAAVTRDPRGWPRGAGELQALAVIGPPACGKSHLARLLAANHPTTWLEADALILPRRPGDLVIIDGCPPAPTRSSALALLSIYHALAELRCPLLVTARAPPAMWTLPLPDLTSRLAAIATVAIAAPDEAMMIRALTAFCARRQLRLPPSLLSYIVLRIERSIPAARDFIASLDRAALLRDRPINLALVRELLHETSEDAHGS